MSISDAYAFWDAIREQHKNQTNPTKSTKSTKPTSSGSPGEPPRLDLVATLPEPPEQIGDPEYCWNRIHKTHLVFEEGAAEESFSQVLFRLCKKTKIIDCPYGSCKDRRAQYEKTAPSCEAWPLFRNWAIVLMSCYAFHEQDEARLAPTMYGIDIVRECCKLLHKKATQDGSIKDKIERMSKDLHVNDVPMVGQVIDVIYWMALIIREETNVSASQTQWNQEFLPVYLTVPIIKEALEEADRLEICKRWVSNMINACPRKLCDIPHIVDILKNNEATLRRTGHSECTAGNCHLTAMNSTNLKQLHKPTPGVCPENDKLDLSKEDQEKKLCEAIKNGKPTAWTTNEELAGEEDKYIAISHVWADGTGKGVVGDGTNKCLFEFFIRIAEKLDCKAVWWDAMSVPETKKWRNEALKDMHNNYFKADYTIIHEASLLRTPWSEDGSPCLALVLSSWFTRGWTAVELAYSKKVMVLLEPENSEQEVLIEDLDKLLARDPGTSTIGHLLASQLIRRLRRSCDGGAGEGVRDVGDLLAILSQRATSWESDRVAIAALLAGVRQYNPDNPCETIQKILKHLRYIPDTCLLHGKSTMNGDAGFSWWPATLDKIPFDASAGVLGSTGARELSMLEVDQEGVVRGRWRCRSITEDILTKITPLQNPDDLQAAFQVKLALLDRESCFLLQPCKGNGNLALVVVSDGLSSSGEEPALKCRYSGTVILVDMSELQEAESYLVTLGEGPSQNPSTYKADAVIGELVKKLNERQVPEDATQPQGTTGKGERRSSKPETVREYWVKKYRLPSLAKLPPPSDRLLKPEGYDLYWALKREEQPVPLVRWINKQSPNEVNEIKRYLRTDFEPSNDLGEKARQNGRDTMRSILREVEEGLQKKKT